MDATDAPEPSLQPAQRRPGGDSRRKVRLGAILALAVAAGLIVWVLVDRSDDSSDSAEPSVTATTPAIPQPASQPSIQTVA
ncbi:MAG TPA: hypothetical protein VF076_00025, partial [Acidimicrobiales bacterium]